MTAIERTARCWNLTSRDRLAWWLFRHVAHPDVASCAWQKYRLSRDAKSVEYTFPNGSTSGHYVPEPFGVRLMRESIEAHQNGSSGGAA